MANPFAVECGAPGTPITVAYFPPAAQLAAQLDSANAGRSFAPVTLPSGTSLSVIVATGSSARAAPVARAATATCALRIYAPDRGNWGSNVYMYSNTSLSNCTANALEANACSDLYQRSVWKAHDCDPQFGSGVNLFSLASAIYDCGHSNVITYTNVGSGYIEDTSGAAAFNSASKSANHSCT